MTAETIASTLVELAAKRFNKPAAALDPNADFFEALGIDSVRALELLTDIEDEFDIEIPDYELKGVTTFNGLAQVIRRRL